MYFDQIEAAKRFPHPTLEERTGDFSSARTTSVLIPLYDLGVCVLAENHSDIHIPTTIRAQILVAQSLALQTHLKGKRLGVTLNLTGERGVSDLWELQFQATMLKSEVAERLRKLCETFASATASRRVESGCRSRASSGVTAA